METAIHRSEVHLWRATLDLPESHAQELASTLSADEITRADRFRFPRDRLRFIAARGTLRAILASYLRQRPEDIRLTYRSGGKPVVEVRARSEGLSFNLSHAHALAVYAIAFGQEVGVDLERIVPEALGLTHEYLLAPGERRVLSMLGGDARAYAFYVAWTRREAYLKALGTGLTLSPANVEVPGQPEGAAGHEKAGRWNAKRWSIRTLTPAPGFVASLCVEGAGWQLRIGEWSTRPLRG